MKIPKNELLIVDEAINKFTISKTVYNKLSKNAKGFIQAKVGEFVHMQGEKLNDAVLGKKVDIDFKNIYNAISILSMDSMPQIYAPLIQNFKSAEYVQNQEQWREKVYWIVLVISSIYLIFWRSL